MPDRKIGDYVVGAEIGRGSFANVYKGYNSKTQVSVAIKSVIKSRLRNKKLIENLEVEISILKNLKHPHVVALLDCEQSKHYFHLLMEYCSLGDLSYFITKREELISNHPLITGVFKKYPSPENSKGLNEVITINFVQQLASALKFLRSQNLVHRDIKPQNLLLSPPVSREVFEDRKYTGLWELPVLKIADFGFARFLPATSMAETLCGSPLYMAPEILRYEKYNAKADLWSVGAVVYEMSVGTPPFPAHNHVELLRNIERQKDKISFPKVAQVPPEIIQLICGLLKQQATERMSFQEFFNDPVITTKLQPCSDEPLLPQNQHIDENLFISEYLPRNSITDKNINNNITNIAKNGVEEALLEEEDEEEDQDQLPSKNDNIQHMEPDSSMLLNKTTQKQTEVQSQPRRELVSEKDYVVVEKRAVEVNALADELEHAGSGALAMQLTNNVGTPYTRRYSSSSRSSSTGSNQRRPSFGDRKVPISISPTNALSKAINIASNRLFKQPSPPKATPVLLEEKDKDKNTERLTSTVFNQNMLNSTTTREITRPLHSLTITSSTSDEEIIQRLSNLTTKAYAIKLLAEIKFSQLAPLPPSNETAVFDNYGDDEGTQSGYNNEPLSPILIKTIGEEGIALYVKTLFLLSKAMNIAMEWWRLNSLSRPASPKLNDLVQWIRGKFNESLEKAEFIKLKLQNAKEQLEESESDTDKTVVAEKLIFDRAIEISRIAVVNELKNDDLVGTELSYATAIWMLEALLEPDDTEESKLDDEDRKMIEKFISSIGNRLSVLRKKIESTSQETRK
ncbi:Serine/threonine-protein kinase [Komagataella phaffii CBS 7435]|uniref:Serine/threonine-protein kinase ATG1 n=3 Tax=Komagataella TaxID=460517 RepID=ATG1_PICPA|nr:Protein serine/threonine kinase required for vesicle formation in autophagy [Komagataella phaffii GS115]Q8TGI1.1 RecName: Full=Serine/threonine-protein kinase ATG1; AltName: Full=Autophagy-related protein 1; AltName: Full=Glucose-induced selective autophagy protein 10; AltName: Full=Pexophagy zeocin-resistant mutant protein 1 [Komagataella pastoris]AOA62191.1 GQ67_00704T0 [Komagataella phaffii]CAH2448188.1 Serine/threonine-protein kinase [Komagataella phaffii CBS 7435]AAL77195.1 protein kina